MATMRFLALRRPGLMFDTGGVVPRWMNAPAANDGPPVECKAPPAAVAPAIFIITDDGDDDDPMDTRSQWLASLAGGVVLSMAVLALACFVVIAPA